MKLVVIGALAVSSLFAATGDTSGPYTDSKGNVWDTLPKVSDYADVATYDALFAHEVFTTRDGKQFHIDRALTPEEEAWASSLHQFNQNIVPEPKSGGSFRATVTTHHPVDEEYQATESGIPALKSEIIGIVEDADNYLYTEFAINYVPTTGRLWDSNDNADIVQLLDEAWNENGGLNGQDMEYAFSDDYTPGGAVGVAYINWPQALGKDYEPYENIIYQHETGHNYGLYHCCSSSCVMISYVNPGGYNNLHTGTSCGISSHYNQWNNARNKY
ncbi:MAG: hypothetical protein DWQ01_18590 [Planctomycetota bacterium]|nr:MAG: hypothetical protein DWQ01_18590 [Planctomycetota bacterium]